MNDDSDEALQSSELIYSDEKLSKAQVDTGAEILTAYRKGRQQFISGEYSTQLVCEYKKETNEKNKKELLSKIANDRYNARSAYGDYFDRNYNDKNIKCNTETSDDKNAFNNTKSDNCQ